MPKGIPKNGINKGWIKKGTKFSKEYRDKISLGHKGKKPHSFSKESRVRMSNSRKGKYMGKNNSQWKGGITPINNKIRSSIEFRLWRKSVF